MRLFDKLLGRAAPPAPAPALPAAAAPITTVVAEPRRPFVNTPALERRGMRAGMWVITPADEVGILTGCRIDGLGEITLQRNDGHTLMEVDAAGTALVPAVRLVDLDELAQADIEDIPVSRRGDIDAMLAMGYKLRGGA